MCSVAFISTCLAYQEVASSYTYTHSAVAQTLSGNVERRHVENEQSKRQTNR